MESIEVDGVAGLLAANLAKLPNRIATRRSSPSGARPIVVVLGMHRSGTSLLSQVLHYLGVDMADETDHVSSRNPGGFWERPELVELQDELMATIGRPLDSPLSYLPFPAGWWRDKPVQPIKKKLRACLERYLAETSGWWGFKDPRTCRLLPIWWEVFDELNLAARYVWALRSPAEAAFSMALKNPAARPMSAAQAEIVWLAYNYDILRYIGATDFVAVEYSEWFVDPLAVAQRLVDRLKLPGFESQYDAADCLRRIVQPAFRHHFAEAKTGWQPTPLSMDFFRELSEMVGSGVRIERMGGYVAILDIVLMTLAPFAELLAELSSLRDRARAFDDVAASLRALALPEPHEALSETDPTYLKAKVARLGAELKRLHNEWAAGEEALEIQKEALGQRIRELEAKLGDSLQHTAAAEAELAAARQSQAESEQRLGQEIAALRRENDAIASEQVALEQRIGEFDAVLAALRQRAAAVETELAAARQRETATEQRLAEELAVLRRENEVMASENEVMASERMALASQKAGLEADLAQARQRGAATAELEAARQRLGDEIAALRAAASKRSRWHWRMWDWSSGKAS